MFESSDVRGGIDMEMFHLLLENAKYRVKPDYTFGHRDKYVKREDWLAALQSSENYKNISKGSFSSDETLTDSEKQYAYLLYTYNKAGRRYTYNQSDSVDSAYMNSLTSKGYNAIVNNGTSSYFRSIQNIVAINGSTTLKEIDTYEMADDEISAAIEKSLDNQRKRILG